MTNHILGVGLKDSETKLESGESELLQLNHGDRVRSAVIPVDKLFWN